MKVVNRKSILEDLKKYSPGCNENDWIEITQWSNGEGWDICMNDKRHISLHYDELDVINYLTKHLEYNGEDQ